MSNPEFTTLVDVSAGNSQGKAQVTWSLELELRKYGVKSIILTVPDQRITVDWEDEDDEDAEPEVKLIEDCGTDGCFSDANFPSIAPTELRWDKRSGWTLIF